jgi:TonB family protein
LVGRPKAIVVLGSAFALLSLVSARGSDTSAAEVTPPTWLDGPALTCMNYFPPGTMQANAQGSTQVVFIVDTGGSVRDVHVSQSSGSAALDQASIACAQHFRYRPAKRAGILEPVEWSATVLYDQSKSSLRDGVGNVSSPASDGPPHSCLNYYPIESLRANVQGVATVGFVIEADGSVSDVHITQSSGNPQLDWATIACAQHWRYIPAKREGVAIAHAWSATVQYALK